MHTTRRTRARLLAITIAVAAFLPASPAHAQDVGGDAQQPDGRWSVRPGGENAGERPNFAFNLAPGQRIVDTVQVVNLSDEAITFAVYAKDAYNTAGDAGFALQDDDQEPVGVGSWVRLAPDTDDTPDTYTIAARGGIEIPFEIAVPADAEPGDHAGGILATDTAPPGEVDDDNVGIAIRQRIGTRIYVRIDGPTAPGLQVTDLTLDAEVPFIPWSDGSGSMVISYEVTNVGNVRLDSTAEVSVTGLLGRTVRDLPSEVLPELLPGSSVRITQRFSGLPPIEPLTARVRVGTVDEIVTTSRSGGAFVISWGILVIPFVLAAALVAVRRWRGHRAQRAAATGAVAS